MVDQPATDFSLTSRKEGIKTERERERERDDYDETKRAAKTQYKDYTEIGVPRPAVLLPVIISTFSESVLIIQLVIHQYIVYGCTI